MGLVGQLTPRPLDLRQIRGRALRLPDWGKDPVLSTPRGLLMPYAGNLSAVADLFVSAPLNTNDRPLIEFLAPRLTRINIPGNTDWFTGETLASFYDVLEKRFAGTSDPLWPASKEIADARRAGTALYHYAVAAARHDNVAVARYQTEVRELVPEVVLAVGAANSQTSFDKPQQNLEGLLRQQETLRHQLEEMQRRLRKLSEPTDNRR